ncbi:MAG: peptidoglycan editing factor PgeF [Planctomycetota bacterium]
MSSAIGPDAPAAAERRQRLCTALGADASRLTVMEQVHGTGVAVVDEGATGRCIAGVDGLVVDRAGVPLMALSADCPLVLVCDPTRKVLGLAHAGWQGTLGRITSRLVHTLITAVDCDPGSLLAAIAPSAGPCCYEVGEEVLHRAGQQLPDHERFFSRRGGSLFFDLWLANIAQLNSAGISAERIDAARRCTICDERFFSYRRDGQTTGHAGLVAVLE